MPHPRDQLVKFEDFEAEIGKLERLLNEFDIDVPTTSDLAEMTRRGFAVLYYSMFVNERPTMSQEQTIAEGRVLAGLGDLAMKINRAHQTTGFTTLRPHLANMVKGAVQMNAPSSVTDDAANKNSELYVGCLALCAGMTVELEDPVSSGGGQNPDILLRRAGRDWSIAVKASHSSKPATIFGNIKKAVEQIERSKRSGLVFVNLKNVVEHEGLARLSPFHDPDSPRDAVTTQLRIVVDKLQAEIVEQDWIDLFAKKWVRPLVVFMAQITVSVKVPLDGEMFMPVKVMLARPFPPAPSSWDAFTGLDAEALEVVKELNEELQRNPPS